MKLSEIPQGSAYAGIGARKTPTIILKLMRKIATKLSNKYDFVLRSGAAEGADQAFESGTDLAIGHKEIYLPWKGFNYHKTGTVIQHPQLVQKAEAFGEKYHLAWKHLSDDIRKFMVRNAFQVLGADLNSPSEFVLCWTPDGANGTSIETTCKTGGTGQAIRIAAAHGIPVINLFDDMKFYKWSEWAK